MRVLTVCLGNICRSPAAEAALRARAPDWQVDSAGTSGWHIGEPPYPPMQRAARARGLDLSGQRARRFVPGDFGRFDLILALDRDVLADVEALRPDGAAAEVALFAAPHDVPDPYYTRDFEGCLDLIETAAARIVAERR